ELPEVLKLEVGEGKLEVFRKPTRLRLGVDTLYNLPVVIRNQSSRAVDVKIIGRVGELGAADRFAARSGVSYFSFNLRPRVKGSTRAALKIYAGMDLPEGGSPPESTLFREVSFPVEVVGWGRLRLKTSVPARVYVAGSDGLSYTPTGALARITWSSGDYFYYSRGGVDEIRLPEGQASVEAVQGFEYAPVSRTLEIREGQGSELALALERRENLAAEGWYSGDVHIHGNYNNHEF